MKHCLLNCTPSRTLFRLYTERGQLQKGVNQLSILIGSGATLPPALINIESRLTPFGGVEPKIGSNRGNTPCGLSLDPVLYFWHALAFFKTVGGFASAVIRRIKKVYVKQAARFLVKPGAFFNQLQWSRHHGYILFAFLLISAIEAQVGREHTLYQVYANYLSQSVGLSFDLALWIIVAGKIAVLIFGSHIVGNLIWFIGNWFGTKNSRRVLVRRLSIVFTVALAAYTTSHLETLFPWMGTLSFFLTFWSLLLGYFALREQFVLSHVETALVGVLTVLLVVFSWNISNSFFESAAKKALKEIAFQPKPTVSHSIKPRY